MNEKNLIAENLGKNVNLSSIPAFRIFPDEVYSSRENLTMENCMDNIPFVELLDNIRDNGQQEPIHVYAKTPTEFVCVAGYRRSLALQMLSKSENSERPVTAFVWSQDTPQEVLFMIATFTNSSRQNLSIMEKVNLFQRAKELYPEKTLSQLGKTFSLSRNDASVLNNFCEFLHNLNTYLGDINHADSEPYKFTLCSQILDYIKEGVLKLGTFERLVQLSKNDLLKIRESDLNPFDIQLELFKTVMNDQFSFKRKKDVKDKYITNIIAKSLDDIAIDEEIKTENERMETLSEEMDKVVDETQKEVEKEVEKELEETLDDVDEAVLDISSMMGDDDTDVVQSVITIEDQVKVALEGLYNSLVNIDVYDLKSFIEEQGEDIEFHRNYNDGEKKCWNYNSTTEFYTNLNKLLDNFKDGRKYVFESALKRATKEDIKTEKAESKADEKRDKLIFQLKEEHNKAMDKLRTEFETSRDKIKEDMKGLQRRSSEREALKELLEKEEEEYEINLNVLNREHQIKIERLG